jgi:hypothetical protein
MSPPLPISCLQRLIPCKDHAINSPPVGQGTTTPPQHAAKGLLALGKRGQVKRRVRACTHAHARTHMRPSPALPPSRPPLNSPHAPRAQKLPPIFSSQPLFLPLFSKGNSSGEQPASSARDQREPR